LGINVESNEPFHLLRRVTNNAIAALDLLRLHSGSDADKQNSGGSEHSCKCFYHHESVPRLPHVVHLTFPEFSTPHKGERAESLYTYAMNSSGVVVSLSGEIYIGGTRHLSARDTARKYCYVRDYVARLCRQGKVAGRQLGRLWYVDVDSFASFLKHNNRSEPEPAHSAI
jgi:hypothetical protein